MENKSREDSLQNAKQCLPDCFYMWNCANNYNTTLGHNMFLILQTVFSNWVRRLAVRAPDERPLRIVLCANTKQMAVTDRRYR